LRPSAAARISTAPRLRNQLVYRKWFEPLGDLERSSHGPVVLEDPDLLKAAAFLRDLAFPPCVMQAGLIHVPHRFAPVQNGSVDESRLPGDDVK
jgi:hypothetical protein